MAKSILQIELRKQTPFESLEQEAYLNLLRTYGMLSAPFMQLFKQHGITNTQYNALRILRGAGGELPCLDIAERMVHRVPDVTRLIDRLVQAKLVMRRRSRVDRRVVLVRVTPQGHTLLDTLDHPVRDLRKQQLGHMPHDALTTLNQLLVKLRTPG